MRYLIGFFLVFMYTTVSLAETCKNPRPETVKLSYQKGSFLPVYFSSYQLDLPEVPIAFLSGDGFIAVYPDKGYVGMQQVDPQQMADSLSRLAPGLASVSDFYRLIYGILPVENLTVDRKELSLQQRLLQADCRADIEFIQLDDVQVILDPARTNADFHKIIVLMGRDVELVTIRGPKDLALNVVRSIKRRL